MVEMASRCEYIEKATANKGVSSSFEIGWEANVLHPSTELHVQITEDQVVRTSDRMDIML